ncbi:MAG: AI-2E family transporter [Clostridiales bacterium]|nr:AI-2E family transporter [Clostridiales bacterium]
MNLIDRKYAKISIYVILTFSACLLIYNAGPFFGGVWNLIVAVMKPILFGGLISYILMPLVNGFQDLFQKKGPLKSRDKLARSLSVLVVVVSVTVLIILSLILASLMIYRKVASLGTEQIRAMISSYIETVNNFIEVVNDKISDFGLSLASVGKLPTISQGTLADIINGLRGFFTTLLFAIIFSIYFMVDGRNIKRYWWKAMHAVVPKRRISTIHKLIDDADNVFSGYIRGQFIDSLWIGFIISLAMYVIGVPYALAVGLLTGIGNLIPYVGTFIGYMSLLIVYLTSGELKTVLIGAVVLTVIMVTDANVLYPKFLSKTIKVHPLLVIAALIAGSAVGGFLGMIIGVPVAAFIKLQFEHLIEKRNAPQGAAAGHAPAQAQASAPESSSESSTEEKTCGN